MDPVSRLQAGVDQARPIVAAADKNDYDKPTPCTNWTVRQLINHMISALVMFRDIGTHGVADPAVFAQDLIGDNAANSFDTAATAAVKAWSAPGKVDGSAKLPFGEYPAAFALQLPAMDMVVHGWDLARATNQRVNWDPELVAETLHFCEATFTSPEMRGTDFGPPIPTPDTSDDITRLVAFLGRQP